MARARRGRTGSLRERQLTHPGGCARRGRRGYRGPTREPTRRSRQVRHRTLVSGTAERIGRALFRGFGWRSSQVDRSASSWGSRTCRLEAVPSGNVREPPWRGRAGSCVTSRSPGPDGARSRHLRRSRPGDRGSARARRRRAGRHALDRHTPTLARRAVRHASRPPRGDGQGCSARLTRARNRVADALRARIVAASFDRDASCAGLVPVAGPRRRGDDRALPSRPNLSGSRAGRDGCAGGALRVVRQVEGSAGTTPAQE